MILIVTVTVIVFGIAFDCFVIVSHCDYDNEYKDDLEWNYDFDCNYDWYCDCL